MNQGRPVKELWWEGDTLCTEFEDGAIMKFEGAYMTSMDYGYEDSDCIQTETFVAEPFELSVDPSPGNIVIKSEGMSLGVLEAFKGVR